MQQFTIYICEDSKEHSSQLSEVCSALAGDYPHTLNVFSTAESLLEQMQQLQKDSEKIPDLILLDIELGQMDGITLGKKIKQMYPEVFLVFPRLI